MEKKLISLEWNGAAQRGLRPITSSKERRTATQLQSNKFNSSFICFPPALGSGPPLHSATKLNPLPSTQTKVNFHLIEGPLKFRLLLHSLSFGLVVVEFAFFGGAIGGATAHNPTKSINTTNQQFHHSTKINNWFSFRSSAFNKSHQFSISSIIEEMELIDWFRRSTAATLHWISCANSNYAAGILLKEGWVLIVEVKWVVDGLKSGLLCWFHQTPQELVIGFVLRSSHHNSLSLPFDFLLIKENKLMKRGGWLVNSWARNI